MSDKAKEYKNLEEFVKQKYGAINNFPIRQSILVAKEWVDIVTREKDEQIKFLRSQIDRANKIDAQRIERISELEEELKDIRSALIMANNPSDKKIIESIEELLKEVG